MILGKLRERFHAFAFGDSSDHPSGTSKIERWRSYPFETSAHNSHDTSTTAAKYGAYRVCYCYTCDRHYRTFETVAP